MKAFRAIACIALIIGLAALVSQASNSRQEKSQSGVGVVMPTDASLKVLTIRTDAGDSVAVQTDANTVLVRIPAGERSLANAVTIQFGDITSGDRVLSSGMRAGQNFVAQRVVAMPAAEVEKKRQRDLDEWKQRGVGGIVRATDPEAHTITLELRGPNAGSGLTIETTKAHFRRYIPGSLKFEDARASNFDDVHSGDQLRALGDKTGDGKFVAEQIVSGAFKTIGISVAEIDQQRGEIRGVTLDQKKPVTIVINKDSVLRRITPPVATAIAQKAKGEVTKPAAGAKPSSPIIDVQQMIDTLPMVSLSDLKPGDVLAVTGAVEETGSQLVAIKVAAGVDLVLKALTPPGKPQVVRLSAGLPSVFDFSVIPIN